MSVVGSHSVLHVEMLPQFPEFGRDHFFDHRAWEEEYFLINVFHIFTYNTVLANEGKKNKDKTDTIFDLLEASHVFGMNHANMKDSIRPSTEMTGKWGVMARQALSGGRSMRLRHKLSTREFDWEQERYLGENRTVSMEACHVPLQIGWGWPWRCQVWGWRLALTQGTCDSWVSKIACILLQPCHTGRHPFFQAQPSTGQPSGTPNIATLSE